MADITMIKNIGSNIATNSASQKNPAGSVSGASFDEVINEAMSKASQLQNDVDKAVGDLSKGGDVTSAILAVEKADMSFQLMVEIRNKLISTYEEVMRLPV
ncbi:MAG: flagellar hook-basal body complex protein FliE [Nitrospirae bacterium]|nr:flagellar hook-basal body complex protein FliE [Nitrospirota bacterium]MBI5056688.1 flagellar hook-basal body complex protein FliE [Nitrospirota bacterium]